LTLQDTAVLEKTFRRPGVYGVFFYPADTDEKQVPSSVAVVAAAKRAGVKHFVFSSAVVYEGAPSVRMNTDKSDIEEWIRQSKMRYTILRPVYFMENHLRAH